MEDIYNWLLSLKDGDKIALASVVVIVVFRIISGVWTLLTHKKSNENVNSINHKSPKNTQVGIKNESKIEVK